MCPYTFDSERLIARAREFMCIVRATEEPSSLHQSDTGGYDYELADELACPSTAIFNWPPPPEDDQRCTPTASPLYIPPPGTQHVQVTKTEHSTAHIFIAISPSTKKKKKQTSRKMEKTFQVVWQRNLLFDSEYFLLFLFSFTFCFCFGGMGLHL